MTKYSLELVVAHFNDYLLANNIDPKKVSLHIMAEDMDTIVRLTWLANNEISRYELEPPQRHTLGFIRTIQGINVRILNREAVLRNLSYLKDAL